MQHSGVNKAKILLARSRIVSLSRVACLPMNCCFNKQTLYKKFNSSYWSSVTKQTTLKINCSCHVAEKWDI